MKKFLLLILGVLSFQMASAQFTPAQYTWAEDAVCVFYTNCTSCHFPGGVGPFSLLDYGNAFAQKYSIKDAVLNNRMPPWPPDKNYRTFAHERLLTQTEKDIIVNWVDGGALIGDTNNAPVPPVYSAASQLGTIDFTGDIGNYTNPIGETSDHYRCFVIPTRLLGDKYISDIEIIPGTSAMVHHVLVYSEMDTNALIALQDPGTNGYDNFGGTGLSSSKLIAGWVPGAKPLTFPAGMGAQLIEGAYIVMQIHYAPETNGMTDINTHINLKFSPPVRVVTLEHILNHGSTGGCILTPSPLFIAQNSTASFVEEFTAPGTITDSITVISVAPHMHLMGKSIKIYAIKPDNDTVPLINIPNWDFHWQGFYDFRQPLVFPGGTKLRAEAFYDNTTSTNITAGEGTENEMMIVFFGFLLSQPGDADIVVDTNTIKPIYPGCQSAGIENNANTYAHFNIYPNPTSDLLNISFEQYEPGDVQIALIDMTGKVLVEYLQPSVGIGTFTKTMHIGSFSNGIYYLRIWARNEQLGRHVIISK